MQFSVPQFIDVKEKIFGPLTLTQFIYLASGGGLCFLLFQVLEIGLFIVVAFPIMLIAVMLAFYKYKGMPFSKFILVSLRLIRRPRVRVWKRVVEQVSSKKEEEAKRAKEVSVKKLVPEKSSLEKLSYVLDTEGGALLHEEAEEEKRKAKDSKREISDMTSDEKRKRTEEIVSGLY